MKKLLPLVVLIASAAPAWAVDLTKIDRTIANEPKYRSATPKYCLLVFGPEAKSRVWLVVDRDVVHMSQTDGDLQGPQSQAVPLRPYANSTFALMGEISEVDGTKHSSLTVRWIENSWRVSVALAGTGRVACRLQGAGFDPSDKLQFGDRPQDAPIIHFNGTRTLGLSGPTPTLQRGSAGTEIMLGFGTPGLGKGTFAAFQGCAVEGNVSAVIAFPSATDSAEKVYVRTTISNNH